MDLSGYPQDYEGSELYTVYPVLYKKIIVEKRNVLLTGPGGVGKSYTIGLIKRECDRLNIKCALTSTTGVSAYSLGLGASTIHRFSGIKLGDKPFLSILENIKTKKDIMNRWRDTNVLVIDEVSMLGSRVLTLIDNVAQNIRLGTYEIKNYKKHNKPIPVFGGLQIIFSADFLQLSPVNDEYCFKSPTWKALNLYIFKMETPYRYPDIDHFNFLCRIRKGFHTKDDIDRLFSRVTACNKYMSDLKNNKISNTEIKPTRIFSLKRDIENINLRELEMLDGDTVLYEATDTFVVKTDSNGVALANPDNINVNEYVDYMNNIAPFNVFLKPQAQIMLTKNLDIDLGLVNGSRGIVLKCEDEQVLVQFKHTIIGITPYVYEYEDETILYNRVQFPLSLAWSSSCHKSQSMTLDSALIDFRHFSRLSQHRNILGRNFDKVSSFSSNLGLSFLLGDDRCYIV